ncbi:MAG: peptidylprolyl isomerase [Planctomycetota bacterium]
MQRVSLIWAAVIAVGIATCGILAVDATPSDANPVEVRVDGHPLLRSEYDAHLRQELGLSRLSGFVDQWLVERRARELGVSIDRVALERWVDDEVARQVDGLFGGERSAFEASLTQRLMTVDDYRAWKRGRERVRFLLDACVRAERRVSDAQVVEAFEALYGPGGIHRRIRHLYLLSDRDAAAKRGGERGADSRPAEVLVSAILDELRDDPDRFSELVARYSDDPLTRSAEGNLIGYRPGGADFTAEFHRTVERLDRKSEVAGPVPDGAGVHLVQLIDRNVTRFESVEQEIRDHLGTLPPTAAERRSLLGLLRKKARIDR